MKNNSVFTDILLSTGALGLLLLAFVLELILAAFIPGTDQPISASVPVMFLSPLFELLLMCAAVGLIWVMNTNRGYGRLVSAVYLIVGLLVLYSNALLGVLPLPDALYVLIVYAAPDTLVFQAAGAVAALGLVSLWFWKAPESALQSAETAADEAGAAVEG